MLEQRNGKIKNNTDLFLYDLKLLNEKKHISYTGKSNRLILENVNKLSDVGAEIINRIPMIPSINDSQEDIRAFAGFVRSLKRIQYVELIPFHPMAGSKYKSLGEVFAAAGIRVPEAG